MGVFDDSVVPTAIISYSLVKKTNHKIKYLFRPLSIDFNKNLSTCLQNDFLDDENYRFNIQLSFDDKYLMKKMNDDSLKLKDVCELKIGIEGAPKYINDKPISAISKPLVRGRNFNRYYIDFENDSKYIEYDRKKLHRPREERLFNCQRKILIRQTGDRIISTIDTDRLYAWKSVFVILCDENKLKIEYMICLLNSSLLNFYYQKIVGETGRTFAQVKGVNLNLLPIKLIQDFEERPFIAKADIMLDLNKQLQTEKSNFIKSLKEDKGIEKLTRKLDAFYDLKYEEFKKELRKKKIKIQLGNENSEWREYFNTTKQKIKEIQSQISKTEKEIDQKVYKLYGLTEEEIKIVENAT